MKLRDTREGAGGGRDEIVGGEGRAERWEERRGEERAAGLEQTGWEVKENKS